MTENAYAALESLGSSLTRQVGSRDSWALFGKKGAQPGTVPEVHMASGSGPSVISHSLIFSKGGDSYSVLFQDLSPGESRFIAFEPSALKEPRMIVDEQSSLRSESNGADYLIVTHKKFKAAPPFDGESGC